MLRLLYLKSFERLADYQGRGVVTTATYAAREFGIRSGMALMQALTFGSPPAPPSGDDLREQDDKDPLQA